MLIMGETDNDIKQVVDLEKTLLTSVARTDQNFLTSVLSEDFVECGATGEVFNKNEILKHIEKQQGSITFDFYGMEATKLTDDVIINRFVVFKSSEEGRSIRFSLWKRHAKGWKIVYHQGTYVLDDTENE